MNNDQIDYAGAIKSAIAGIEAVGEMPDTMIYCADDGERRRAWLKMVKCHALMRREWVRERHRNKWVKAWMRWNAALDRLDARMDVITQGSGQ